MRTHILKCWPAEWDAVADGRKKCEWRRDDRGYAVDDVLVLRKWDPSPSEAGIGEVGYVYQKGTAKYCELRVRVTHIVRGKFGVPPDFCVMSIERDA